MSSRFRLLSVLCVVATVCAVPLPAQTSGPESTTYALRDFSSSQEGCFDPCMCPILALFLGGTFDLTPTGTEGDFQAFDIENVDWIATVGGPIVQQVTGQGTYAIGAEEQQIVLDLQFDGGPVEHYDSGLVPVGVEFPAIAVLASIGDLVCYDEVVDLRAAPLVWGHLGLSVDPATMYWSVTPGVAGYDVVTGDLASLRYSGGDFTASTEACLAQGQTTPVLGYGMPMGPGHGAWFLVRGTPEAPYDSNGASQEQSRDAEIELAPGSCP